MQRLGKQVQLQGDLQQEVLLTISPGLSPEELLATQKSLRSVYPTARLYVMVLDDPGEMPEPEILQRHESGKTIPTTYKQKYNHEVELPNYGEDLHRFTKLLLMQDVPETVWVCPKKGCWRENFLKDKECPACGEANNKLVEMRIDEDLGKWKSKLSVAFRI